MKITRKIFFASVSAAFLSFGIAAAEAPTPKGEPPENRAGQESGKTNGVKIAPHDEKTAAFLRQAVAEQLKSQIPEAVLEWRVAELNWASNENLPVGYDDYRVTSQKRFKGTDPVALVFEFSKNGRTIKRLGVTARIEMFAEVVVSKSKILRGTPITAEMVAVERKLLTVPAEDACFRSEEVEGRVAERTILPDRVVQKSQLGKTTDVRTGEIVVIVAQSDTIRLSAKGIAKMDGAIGETIPVVNVRSNKKLMAKVVDTGTVQVEF